MTRSLKQKLVLAAAVEGLETRRLLSAGLAPAATAPAGSIVARPDGDTGTGFFVAGGKVYDATGHEFIIRGFNHTELYGDTNKNIDSISEFAKTGANAVRAVVGTFGAGASPAQRSSLVQKYLAAGIVPILEDHSVTNSQNPADIQSVTDRWLQPGNVQWLKQNERNVILDIANEWGPSTTVYRDAYISSIAQLRAAGVNSLIMIDAGGSGQNAVTFEKYAQDILNADPQHNIVFSLHMYNDYRTEGATDVGSFSYLPGAPWDIKTELTKLQSAGLPLVVGEYAMNGGTDVGYDTQRALQIFEQMGIGSLAWSWNQSGSITHDLVATSSTWQYDSNSDLSAFGKLVITDPVLGLKANALPAASLRPARIDGVLSGLDASAVAGATVYIDDNNNGQLDSGELSSLTDASGAFSFTNLPQGVEHLRVVTDATAPLGAQALTVALPAGTQAQVAMTLTDPAAVSAGASISGVVFNDTSRDGYQNGNESGLTGQQVFLDLNNDGQLSDNEPTTTTDSNGLYTFTGLAAGSYTLGVVLPSGFERMSSVFPVTVAADDKLINLSIGIMQPPALGSIAGTIFNDANANGVRDPNESGYAYRFLYIDANGNGAYDNGEINTLTATDGSYLFTRLTPGTYSINRTNDGNALTTTLPINVTVNALQTTTADPTGITQLPGSIGGIVFNDADGNGSRGASETPAAGITVYIDSDSNQSYTAGETQTVTDANGAFSFPGLKPGSYAIRAVPTAGLSLTTGTQYFTLDSSVNYTGMKLGIGVPAPVVPPPPVTPTAVISGVYFQDTNGDHVMQSGEPRMANAIVFLDTNSSGTLNPGEPYQVTDQNGAFSFTGLAAGMYHLRTVTPNLYALNTTQYDVYLTNAQNFSIARFGVVPANPPVPQQILEAENATLTGGTTALKNHANYTGTGFADYGGDGSAVQFTVSRSVTGTATLIFRYANGGTAARPLSVIVNGATIGSVACAPTGSWDTWKTVSIDAPLISGTNIVKAVAGAATGGNLDSLTIQITPPTAVIGGPYAVAEGSSLTLDGSGSIVVGATILKYEWDFNYDGQTFDVDATGQQPTFSAGAIDGPATRTIALRITDSNGQTSIKQGTISVTNANPTADFSGDSNAVASTSPATVTFANATDPSAADVAAGLQYSYDFNNDGDFTDPGESANSNTSTASYVYATQGTYTVHGRIADKDGAFTDYYTTVTVNPAPPTAVVGGPYTVVEGSAVALDGSASQATGATLQTYEWDFNYDGQTFDVDATGQQPLFSASNIDGPAAQTIALRVTDSNGLTSIQQGSVTVTNANPTATLSGDANGLAGLKPVTVTFANAADASAADIAAGLTYSYDFNNDGDFTDAGESANSASPTASYVYATSGDQIVHGRVSDKDGGYSDVYTTVTIAAPVPPSAVIGGPYTVAEGSAVVLDGSASVATGATIQAYEWDYNYDGQTFDVDATGQQPNFSASNIDGPATRTIALRITDSNGLTSLQQGSVTITSVSPTATFTGDATAVAGKTPSTVTFTNATDPSAADVAAGLTYSYDFNNDGDFTDPGESANSASASASYVYATGGNFTVHGRVSDKDGAFTDYTTQVTVTAPPSVSATLEAETATLTGGTAASTAHLGYTGSGFADYGGNGSAIQWTAPNMAGGYSSLTFRYANGSGAARPLTVVVNGVTIGTVACIPTTNWDTWSTVSINTTLLSGTNTITAIAGANTGGNVDSLSINPAVAPPPPPSGSISGFLFNDLDSDGLFDHSDTKVAGQVVYLDADSSGTLNGSEISVTSDANGNWSFTGLTAGAYHVREVIPAGYTASTAPIDVSLSDAQAVTGQSFGVKAIPVVPPPATVTLEAEDALLTAGTFKQTNHANYTGTGFADYGGSGSAAQWSFTRNVAGQVSLGFRYANGATTARPLTVYVNGVVVGTINCAPTGSWDTWQTESLVVTLTAGSQTVKAVAGAATGANVDSLIIPAESPIVIPPVTTPVLIDAGGPAAGSFAADNSFTGGSTYSSTAVIDTSLVTNAGPQSVYQTERFGNFSYTVANLVAGKQYSVQLDFDELYWSVAGKRVFNVTGNGAAWLTSFDIYAAAGGKNKAISRTFTATADTGGKITVAFQGLVDNAKVNALRVTAVS